MKNYKLTIQYDGCAYNGWQKQGNTTNTIQERFENVLFKMCNAKIEIHASGRTDAGVHAENQIANFKCNTDMNCEEIKKYLNKYLPKDIFVKQVEEVDERFHSRLNTVSKTYEYTIATEKSNVFNRKYVYTTDSLVDVKKMIIAAELFMGKHDFKGFSSVGRTKKSTVRTINYIQIKKEDDIIKIIINGTGFLYNMVRIISGTLLEIGEEKLNTEIINEIFITKDRKKAGKTLPACGLKLMDVEYL